MAKPFISDHRGTVFVLFSLILPVILTGILGLMSLSGLTTARADLQAASSAAANAVLADLNASLQLSATPDALVLDVDKQLRATAVVQSLLGSRSDLTNVTTLVTTTATSISVTVSADVRNVTGDIFALPFFSNLATTTVPWMRQDQLQVVLSIDSGVTAGKSSINAIRMKALKPILVGAVDILSMLPNYPNVGVSLVPFTAQISTDPAIVTADSSDPEHDFLSLMTAQFAEVSRDVFEWAVPRAQAGVTQCYNDPIVPKGANGSPFLGTQAPLPQPCESAVTRLRPLAKISVPYSKGLPSGTEPLNAPAKLARDDIRSAINALTPAGCRNLAMGVTWSMAQLPKDNNPKVIIMIANGNNSQSQRGRTAECAGPVSRPVVSQLQLDNDFLNACALLRDPAQNKGNVLDLFVLQLAEGNSIALKSCASTSDNVVNYFDVSSSPTSGFMKSLTDGISRIAKVQRTKHEECLSDQSNRWSNPYSKSSDDQWVQGMAAPVRKSISKDD